MKIDPRITELNKRILLAEKAGNYPLFNKLRRQRAGTLGNIALQNKRSGGVGGGQRAIIAQWEIFRPREGDLFADSEEKYEIIRSIAEKTGFTADYVRKTIANRED